MTTDLIRYDLLSQEALKGVVRKVLTDAARDGLPGDHHFYVSFRTDHPAVKISSRLRERYPQDMTIVLQHQFDALTVNEQGFEVGLSFSGVPERLRVPFAALSGFFDPSVQFGMKFEALDAVPAAAEDDAAASLAPGSAGVTPIGGGLSKLPLRRLEAVPEGDGTEAEEKPGKVGKQAGAASGSPAEPADAAGAEVVSLDSFRKKS